MSDQISPFHARYTKADQERDTMTPAKQRQRTSSVSPSYRCAHGHEWTVHRGNGRPPKYCPCCGTTSYTTTYGRGT